MTECALCGNSIPEREESSTLEISDVAVQAVVEQYDFHVEQSINICTCCLVQLVVDYLYTSQNN